MPSTTKPLHRLAEVEETPTDIANRYARQVAGIRELGAAAAEASSDTIRLTYRATSATRFDEFAEQFDNAADAKFRAALFANSQTDFRIRNAISSNLSDNAAGRSFVDTFMGAAVQAAPLLDLAAVATTAAHGPVDFSYITSQITANGIVAEGGSITADDPTFGPNAEINSFGYKSMIEISTSTATDAAFDMETFVSERCAPINARALSTDLWGGDGSGEPQGLLAGLTTVNAAGGSVVTFDDIAALLAGVPAAYRYGGRCTILLSPGAHIDLLEEDPNYAWHTGTIHGFPFRVDPALADPDNDAKSAVAGDFRSAYFVRLAPVRVDTSGHAAFEKDLIKVRFVLGADGRRMVTDAARALVHPGA